MNNRESWPVLSPMRTGLSCNCPRCGRGTLYKGLLEIRDRCTHCDLDLSCHDTGDGATVFVILILGALVVGLALWLEASHAPPIWVHLVVWVPAITILSIAMLRPFKGILVGYHYRNLRHKYQTGPNA
ncbi:MAG: DUF983 domain-containing protein [Pseudomonadota bacterium]|nr:DUF983 domain-containing protein [Pseudomonadota bacterium]